MKIFMVFFCAFYSICTFASSTAMDLSEYDIDKRIEFEQFTFLPIQGSSTLGAFVYSTYNKQLLGPTGVGFGWKSLVLSVRPVAIETEVYNDFIVNNNIIDRRDNLIAADENLCQLTDSVKNELYKAKAIYTTRVIFGGYPKACSLTVRYYLYPEGPSEEMLLSILSGESVVALSYSLSSEPRIVATVNFHDIIGALAELGVVAELQPGEFEGLVDDVLSQGMLLDPALFGGEESIPQEAWDLFVSGFTFYESRVLGSLTDDNRVLVLEEPSVHLVTVDEEI